MNSSIVLRRFFATLGPKTTRVGWIGTGVMGGSMCQHLIDAGYQCTVFNRTPSKCNGLVAKGAKLVSSPLEVAQNSDVVFSIVGYPADVRQIALGEKGLLKGLKKGGIYVDMTTSQPSLAQELYAAAKEQGCTTLDAPVSGGDVGARTGKLSIMVGGDKTTYDDMLPLFGCMGTNIKYMGGPGCGQHTKMVNQILISTMMIGVCEGLLYGYKAGLNLDEVIAAVGAGAAGSWSINNLGPRMLKRDFNPGFFVDHFIKDMGIALEEAKRMNLSLPGLALANQLYMSVKAQGNGKLGTQALMLALESMNGMDKGISVQKKD
ncbi:hypothetical protein WA171_004192, partial [Blastocystis sp. BT1]